MISNKDVFCVIMAGGVGSRFWPLSRANKPKQFLDILGTGSSLIQQTYNRSSRFCPPENIYIVTGANHKQQVLEHLPKISEEQVLLEPIRRNTAPCIALANQKILSRNPNAIVVVTPSDHLIIKDEEFFETINSAIKFASTNESLITIGIKPTHPETGYGYIQVKELAEGTTANLYKVKTFTEKPNLELAELFVKTGEFFWNSGVFVWSIESIMKAFIKYLPEVSILFSDISDKFGTPNESEAISSAYTECRNISIDYGIMEKADNVYVICSDFGWCDLGTWGSLYLNSSKDSSGNSITGNNVMPYNVRNCLVNVPNHKLVVIEGLSDYIVVESDNVILICSRSNEQNIKQYLNDVLLEKGERFT